LIELMIWLMGGGSMGFISVVDEVFLVPARQKIEIGFCSGDNRCTIASRAISPNNWGSRSL
jgi:hypothetical protein